MADNREALGTTSDKLAGVTQALTDSLDDVKQFLHVAPNTLQNYVNIWQPAQGAASSVPMINNFANPISFLCGAVQAASRLGAEQSAKLCVQYLAPIIKNRQFNFLPVGAERLRRCHGAAERDHLQRGLDAAGLHSAAATACRSRLHRPRLAAPAPRRAAAGRRGADRDQPGRRPDRNDGAAGGRTMMRVKWIRAAVGLMVLALALVPGCGWRGLNSIPLPGVQGAGPGAFTIQAQMPDVDNIEQNSRVRVGDVNVGTVTEIERQGWHALVTMRLNGDVQLPANATAKLGQTSLLGSLHIELAPPTEEPPQGKLHEGSLIPLASSGKYPSTEQTLAAIALLLNGGGIGNIQDITEALSIAFTGRENDLRSLIEQLDKAIGYLNDQKDDIIAATESLNNLVGQFAEQKPVVDKALKTIPDALVVLKDQRDNLVGRVGAARQVQRAGRRLGQPNQGSARPRAQRPWAGAAITGRRRPGADPRAELPAHLPVPQGDADQLDAWRLRQPDVDRRPDIEPDRLRILHRIAVGVRSDLAGDSVGPHHRPIPQPVHGERPAERRRQPVDRSVSLGSGALT